MAKTKTQPAINRRDALNAARQHAEAELAKVQQELFKAFNDILADTASIELAQCIDELKGKSRSMQDRILMFDQAIDVETEQERQRSAAARIETSRQDRAAVIELCNARIADLAPAIDAKFNEIIDLISQYREAGSACDSFCRRALSEMFEGDFQRLNDVGSLTLPRASGTSSDNAVALVQQINRVLEAFESPYLSNYIQINDFLPPINTLTHAAMLDARVLRDWFETRFEIKPTVEVPI